MALFGFLKKKKEEELPLPPPPSPPELPTILKGEIAEIKPAEEAIPTPVPPPAMPETVPKPEVPKFEMLPSELPEKPPEVKPELPAEEIPEKKIMPLPTKPVFVAAEDYKRITADSDAIRAKLMRTEEFVKRLGDLKNEEEKILQKWRNYLEALEKKFDYVDKLIAKAQG